MNPLRPTRPDELATLLMENELLRYEVAHLRARLAAAQAAIPAGVRADPSAAGTATASPEAGEPASESGVDLGAPVRRARSFFTGRHGPAGGDPDA